MPLISFARRNRRATDGLRLLRGPGASALLRRPRSEALKQRQLQSVSTCLGAVQADLVPNDPDYSYAQSGLNGTWGINAPTAWNTTTGSDAVTVADGRHRHRL